MMDTVLLIIGVVGLSISGWVLRGYFLNTPTVQTSTAEPSVDVNSDLTDLDETVKEQTVSYVTSEDHQQVLKRLAELEKGGYVPKVDEAKTNQQSDSALHPSTAVGDSDQGSPTDTYPAEPPISESWKEILALQQAYNLAREQEKEIDYQREQALFDITQGFDGKFQDQLANTSLTDEELMDQKLLDNHLEDGEDLVLYHDRMNQFASLTKEVLITRLDATDRQLREQQEKHQQALLTIISTLIERMPQDVNLKSVIQSSFVAASSEISNSDGEENRGVFSDMFLKHVKN